MWRGRWRERGFEDNYSMKNPGDHCSGYKILNKSAGRMNFYSSENFSSFLILLLL